jgi:flagellar biosynthesis protein FliQ
MNQDTVTHLSMNAMMLTLKVSAPFLLAGLVVGLVVSIFQAATQIQEQTLTFIPKILVTGLVVAVGGPWMLNEMIGYTRALFESIPSLVAGG